MGIGGKIKLEEGTAGGTYVGFKAPDTEITSDLLWELPATDGIAGQVMATNGTKQLYWGNFAEATATANTDSSLQAAINSEITNRTVADSSLQAAILSETTNRMVADSSLQSAILVVDSSLQAAILVETTSRAVADSSLQANIAATITHQIVSANTAANIYDILHVDTTAAARTVTLPGSPVAGSTVTVADAKSTFGVNACTLGRNSKSIRGAASDYDCDISGKIYTVVYIDAAYGWEVYV